MTESDCLFCKVVAGDIPADVVHRGDNVVAFRDINPQAPTHILLIPTEHVASAAEIAEHHGDVLAEIVRTAAGLAESEGIADSGWRLVTNVGSDAGQTVLHLHFHLIGGRPMQWPPG